MAPYPVKAQSLIGDAWGTNGQRIGKLQFLPVRCRALGVRHPSLRVCRVRWTNAGPTLCIRRHSLCASGFFEHANKMCAELDA